MALALAAAAFVAYFAEERILKRADENCFGPFYIIYLFTFLLCLIELLSVCIINPTRVRVLLNSGVRTVLIIIVVRLYLAS